MLYLQSIPSFNTMKVSQALFLCTRSSCAVEGRGGGQCAVQPGRRLQRHLCSHAPIGSGSHAQRHVQQVWQSNRGPQGLQGGSYCTEPNGNWRISLTSCTVLATKLHNLGIETPLKQGLKSIFVNYMYKELSFPAFRSGLVIYPTCPFTSKS